MISIPNNSKTPLKNIFFQKYFLLKVCGSSVVKVVSVVVDIFYRGQIYTLKTTFTTDTEKIFEKIWTIRGNYEISY